MILQIVYIIEHVDLDINIIYPNLLHELKTVLIPMTAASDV